MSAASDIAASHADDDVDRNLALLSYGLLFFAVFFAGAPALVAAGIAYARRSHAEPPARSHFRFQIFVFWVAFVLTVVAALCGLGALLVALGQLLRGAVEGRWDSLDTVLFSQAHIGVLMALVAMCAVAALLASIWLAITSAYGFILLATRQSIRQTAH